MGVEVDSEFLGIVVGTTEEDIIKMVSVAEEQSATVASRTRWLSLLACEVVKPECYYIQLQSV